jgi:radical SAM protein with 4Fe4S-binding SPASM domain
MVGMFSGPTVVNIELTDKCNLKCRHCYNYWREDQSKTQSLSIDKMDRLLDILIDGGVFHVVLSGGEPFANFEVMESGFKKLKDNNISVSCNSNLMMATQDKIKRLADVGVDHILTSLNSHDAKTNDYLIQRPGAHEKIISGIKTAVENGIRISVNMIVSQANKDHVYETGRLVYELGCQKLFGTRVVPSVNIMDVSESEFEMEEEDIKHILAQLVRLKEDTGIMIGTLVSYPLCFLSDLEKYTDFVGRGCPGQSGHFMNINADGQTHACVHEVDSYGNIFEIGLQKAYQNMKVWHDGSYRYQGCEGCRYIELCKTGCRMMSHAYCGRHNQKDPLMVNKDNFVKDYAFIYDEATYEKMETGLKFYASERLRFRKENGFYLVNIRWANTISVPDVVGEFLIKHKESGKEFGLAEFGREKKELLAKLFYKGVIEVNKLNLKDTRNMVGLSEDIEAIVL